MNTKEVMINKVERRRYISKIKKIIFANIPKKAYSRYNLDDLAGDILSQLEEGEEGLYVNKESVLDEFYTYIKIT